MKITLLLIIIAIALAGMNIWPGHGHYYSGGRSMTHITWSDFVAWLNDPVFLSRFELGMSIGGIVIGAFTIFLMLDILNRRG